MYYILHILCLATSADKITMKCFGENPAKAPFLFSRSQCGSWRFEGFGCVSN